jgi:hypothetical protein
MQAPSSIKEKTACLWIKDREKKGVFMIMTQKRSAFVSKRHTINLKLIGTEFSLCSLLNAIVTFTQDLSQRQRAIKISCVKKDGSETFFDISDAGDSYLTFRKTDIPWNKDYPLPSSRKKIGPCRGDIMSGDAEIMGT